ncbi:MAG: peptidyl-prolyl cis-trans isomerase (rotamase) - cyclophilin family [Actinobacteria bacterium]|nr:peptidyl-prolyl cis-trans isomerase (rotamase) - cyclophilin family [Actinomycetota bacterium]
MSKAAKRARKKEGRQARIEAEKKAAARRRNRNRNIVLGVVLVLLLGYLGLNQLLAKPKKKVNTTTPPVATSTVTSSATPTLSPSAPAGVTGTAAACSTTKPARGGTVSQPTPPPMTVSPSKIYTATIVTSCGTVVVALDAKDSPNTVNSFAYLASKGFYDGLTFHRVAKDFAVQGGDPAGTGSGGPGYSVQDNVPAGVTYTMGTVAMAKTGSEPPGTSGSQFFIVPTAGASRGYTPDYAILGHVTSGQDAVTKMNALAPASGDGPPVQPIYIEKITVTSS